MKNEIMTTKEALGVLARKALKFLEFTAILTLLYVTVVVWAVL
jgi:hypothetical protein